MIPSRSARTGARALMIAVPSLAAAIAAGQALAAPAPAPLSIAPRAIRVPYGRELILRGSATASEVGHTIVLEFARRGDSAWRTLSASTIGAAGQFRLYGALTQSGEVRAVDAATGSPAPFVARGNTGGTPPTSSAVPVEVAARLRVPDRQIAALGGQAIQVRGRLLTANARREVSLQARQGGSWRTLARTRTGAGGRFVLRYVTSGVGQERIRIRFGGDRFNGLATASAGQLTVYREAGASWYADGGNTACGFHAYYGVANRTLPCGTEVRLSYNGRSVTATVDDRGPYVGGRDWDLNQNTAAALGFGGVGTVWSSQ